MMPQMDKVTVFNQALAQFGDREYVKGSPAGRTVDLWWPTVLREALLFGAWTWATKRVEMDRSVMRHPIPDDCLRVLYVGADLFRIEGRDLVVERYGKRAAGTDKLVVDYLSDEVARSEVLPDHSPFFIKGVVFLLAGRGALKLASSPQLAAALEAQGEAFLSKALYWDTCQHSSNDQDPLTEILSSSIF